MKITKIEITDFHQFKDLTIDLTYPKGHEKEGKPLDKVCFIGQSGTGKTTLIELFPYFMTTYETPIIKKSGGRPLVDKIKISVVFGSKNEYPVEISLQKSFNSPHQDNWFWSHREVDVENSEDHKVYLYLKQQWRQRDATKIIYFPAKLNYEIEANYKSSFNEKVVIDFSKENVVAAVWNLIFEHFQSYQEQEFPIGQKVIRTVEQSTIDPETIKRTIQEIADNCLDELLAHFKLRVKIALDFKSKEDIGFIKIKDYTDNEIPNELLSTGTKQTIFSALPLYLLKPKHTVILFDEPERSLYPDMQRFIIDYYQSLTEDCQFFYSTHSPITASKFEPWEIVELKFNEEGKVYRELYYEGENHVDNYVVDPRFLNYDLILSKVFDVQGVDTDARMQAITELTMLKNQLERLKVEGKLKSERGKEVFNRYQALGKKLAWNKELADA